MWQILVCESEQRVVTGGADGKLLIWDELMQKLQEIDLTTLKFGTPGTERALMRPDVRSLDFDAKSKTILVGTRGSEVVEVSLVGEAGARLVAGHFSLGAKSELWGVACHPEQAYFATCGADRRIRVWGPTAQQ